MSGVDFCDTFANLSVNEFRVYTIEYGVYFMMQLRFCYLQLECEYVA